MFKIIALIIVIGACLLFLTMSGNKQRVPETLYLVVSPAEWKESQEVGKMMLSSFHDPFIHLSTEEQYPKVIEKFWSGKEYILLKVDPKKIKGRLEYETNPGGSNRYYHLYDGEIPVHSVIMISNL